ncbi:hypothetical protein GW17_00048473 [Ensete ventricosum]|nr:hypothetical protein GW17_00048473 [Ensete ventricosum]
MKRHRRIESHVARMTKPIQQRACFGPAAGVGAVALLARRHRHGVNCTIGRIVIAREEVEPKVRREEAVEQK